MEGFSMNNKKSSPSRKKGSFKGLIEQGRQLF